MSVTKYGDKWKVDVRDRSIGKRIRRIVGTRREGKLLEAKIRQSFGKQKIPDCGIEHALAEYLKGEATTLKDIKGVESKGRAIRPYITGHTFESIGLVQAAIKRDMLAAELKPATINRRLALLRRLANLAFEWGWIDYPAGKRIKLLPGEAERHFYLTMDQVDDLADLCPKTGGLIKIAAMTGLRRSELLKLKPEQIIDEKWIALDTETKNRKPRLVPIPKTARDLVKQYDWPLDFKAYNQLLRNEFEDARAKLNMGHIHFHDLRHSYASFLVQHGGTLPHIGKALGHSSTQMTNRYAHLIDENLMELAEKFGADGGASEQKENK